MRSIILAISILFYTQLQVSSQNISDILEKSIGSVVTVAVYKVVQDQTTQLLGFGASRGDDINTELAYARALDLSGSLGVGSGFMISESGAYYIITNAHVVEKASDEKGSIYIYSINRSKYEMRLIGGDTFYDIAILAFVTPPGPELVAIEFRKTNVRLGERVYAIGNPGGKYPYTISDGIIGALNRTSNGITGKFGFIQSTATVIWGNSGGPLIDNQGKVVGINSQLGFVEGPDDEIYIQPQINLALEAGIATRILNDILRNNGRVIRGYIGIEVSERIATGDRTKMFVDPKQFSDSLPVLTGVIPGSPAFIKLNDKIGYQIIRINDVEVNNVEEVLGEMEKVHPAQDVRLTLQRNGDRSNITVKAIELGEAQLRSIATYVLDKDERIKLQPDIGPVKIMLTTNRSFDYYKFKHKEFNTIKGGAYELEYTIVSAGLITRQGGSTWRVTNMAELGAALRISGLQGVIDIRVIESNNPRAEPETLRFDLSDDRYITRSTLWY